jgi:hypothetical protein
MKKLFADGTNRKGLLAFDTKETVFELNGVKIEAFSSHLKHQRTQELLLHILGHL